MHFKPPESAASRHLTAIDQQLSMLTDMMGLAMWRLDLSTRRLSANVEGFRVVGCDPPSDPEAGLPIEEVRSHIHPEDLPKIESAAERALAPGGGAVDVEARYLQADGSYRTLLTRRAAERDADGRAVSLIGVAMDITEQVRAREQAAVQTRARAAAEAASRAKSLFLARVSHELRTPLHAVLGFTQLLIDDDEQPPDPRQRLRLRHIHDAGLHLLGLVNDTLDLASIEAGTLTVADHPVSLSQIVTQALRWVESMAAEAGVTIGRGPVHGAVRGDARRILQILVNLLSNGIKFNTRGGQVDLAQIDDPQRGRVGLEVVDNGQGMTDAQLANLFEPFERLGAENTTVEGAGIGLSVVRHLVERMGGEVEVSSKAGEGSRFCIWLRAATAADIVRMSLAPSVQVLPGAGAAAQAEAAEAAEEPAQAQRAKAARRLA